MAQISFESFKEVVKNTPLISIDFIIENIEGKVLLGFRKNNPAKNYWFVPGGRIRKNEKFEDAFMRISHSETGLNLNLNDTSFHGIYEHIYPNENFSDDPSFGTHYIVIAYKYILNKTVINLPNDQHTDYWWASYDEIFSNKKVHQNTINYFNGHASFSKQ